MNTNFTGVLQRIWDLPTRVFHWVLVGLIAAQYATAKFNWLDMDWHKRFGYATLALLGFRLFWGFFGSQTSRFSDFVRAPRSVWHYFKSQFSTNPQTHVGHSPLGGLSVLAMLACLVLQAISGLFASDDIMTDGPLVAHVSGAIVKWMTRVHTWNQNLLLILIGLHIVAILFYLLFKYDNLIAPMIHGRKRTVVSRDLHFVANWRALLLLAVCAAAVAALVCWSGA